jgi:hypothetical protein
MTKKINTTLIHMPGFVAAGSDINLSPKSTVLGSSEMVTPSTQVYYTRQPGQWFWNQWCFLMMIYYLMCLCFWIRTFPNVWACGHFWRVQYVEELAVTK